MSVVTGDSSGSTGEIPQLMPSFDELVAAFSEYQRGRAFTASTIKRRKGTLVRFRLYMSPVHILNATADDIQEWMPKLLTARTRHAYLSDLRCFFRWAVRRRIVTVNPAVDVDGPKIPKPVPKPAKAEVISKAYAMAPGRVQLMILLGSLAGLRSMEIAALTTDDLYLDQVPPILVVRGGKGNKDRVVPAHPRLVEALRDIDHGPVFPSLTTKKGEAISPHTVQRQVAKWLSKAAGQNVSIHQLRHFFGTEAARWSDGNIMLVADLMGHSSVATTRGYIGWSPTEGAAVVAKIEAADRDELAKRRRSA